MYDIHYLCYDNFQLNLIFRNQVQQFNSDS